MVHNLVVLEWLYKVRNALDVTYEVTTKILSREHKKIDTLLKKDE